MTERNESGWWLQEPPDDEVRYLPGHSNDDPSFSTHMDWGSDWIYDADEANEEARRSNELAYQNVDVVFDAREPLELFENVKVYDDGSFRVPERFIGTEKYGVWAFSAFGSMKQFKNRDEYGVIRFRQRDGDIIGAIWAPHLYPFEERDQNGLPLIKDRERCEMTVVLAPVDAPDIYPLYIEITIDGQLYGAEHDIGGSYGQGSTYFTEFVAVGDEFTPENVEFHDNHWRNLDEYLRAKVRSHEYHQIMEGEIATPEEYLQQYKPQDWQTRKASDLRANRFGVIMVPVDDLRRGLNAEILFPMFREAKLKTNMGNDV